MYFTRGVCKRVKINNDCIDACYWSFDFTTEEWCAETKRCYPEFDVGVYQYYNQVIHAFNTELIQMTRYFNTEDAESVAKKYPELFTMDPYFRLWLDRKVMFINRRKLSWIYNRIRVDPRLLQLMDLSYHKK